MCVCVRHFGQRCSYSHLLAQFRMPQKLLPKRIISMMTHPFGISLGSAPSHRTFQDFLRPTNHKMCRLPISSVLQFTWQRGRIILRNRRCRSEDTPREKIEISKFVWRKSDWKRFDNERKWKKRTEFLTSINKDWIRRSVLLTYAVLVFLFVLWLLFNSPHELFFDD